MYYDLEINAEDIPDALVELQKYAPYGRGNPKIIFKIPNFHLIPRRGVFFNIARNGKMIKLFGDNCAAVAFAGAEDYAAMGEPKVLDLYGSLSVNTYLTSSENQVELVGFEKKKPDRPQSDLAELLKSKMNLC